MGPHPSEDKLACIVLDELSSPELDEVGAHVATCASCQRLRDQLLATLGDLPLSLAPAEPSPALFQRVGTSLDHLERFATFAPRLAELLALPPNDARRILHVFERLEDWKPKANWAGMRADMLPTGPLASEVTGLLVCYDAGGQVGHHRHWQEERVIVFQGALETDGGVKVGRGDELVSPVDSEHSLRVHDEEDCLCAIIYSPPRANVER